MDHADITMFFYVDSAAERIRKIGGGVRILAEEPCYHGILRKGLKLSAKGSMSMPNRV